MGRKISSGNKVAAANIISETLKPGETLTDLTGKRWVIGKPIGVGGFGEIYLASDVLNQDVTSDSPYVAKIENHSNGPLFVEINCYLRIAKLEMIEEWKQEKGLTSLGMPHYVASGSHNHNGNKYRFLILPRYQTDLESVLAKNKRFNLKTVLTVSMQIIDTLEYIHSKGYVHSDIKASNILLGRAEKKVVVKKPVFCYNSGSARSCNPVRKCRVRNGRPVRSSRSKVFYLDDVPDFRAIEKLLSEEEETAELKKSLEKHSEIDQVYLLDYGLASKYRTSTNTHKVYCNDERKAHMGTMLFCSRDAHKGAQSRRSDLECLAFNIVYWLSGCLPWQDELHDPILVEKRKQRCMTNVDGFLRRCLGDYPEFLLEFFQYLDKLSFEEKPDYTFCKKLFRKALKDYGYKNDKKFDFNNSEGWGEKKRKVLDNGRKRPQMSTLTRLPLHSNFSVRSPKRLRGNIDKQLACLKWSKILIDPEIIIKRKKKSRERKLTEPSDLNESVSVFNMDDISELNPTYAMIEVFSKSKERLLNGTFGTSPTHKSESETTNKEGYTPAMMAVLARMKENQLIAEIDHDDSEDEYYYKFPEPKKPTVKTIKRKTGLKRKSTAASFYTPPKTRIQSEKKVTAPAKRVHRLRG